TAGRSIPTRIAMMAITTSSSISVKPDRRCRRTIRTSGRYCEGKGDGTSPPALVYREKRKESEKARAKKPFRICTVVKKIGGLREKCNRAVLVKAMIASTRAARCVEQEARYPFRLFRGPQGFSCGGTGGIVGAVAAARLKSTV